MTNTPSIELSQSAEQLPGGGQCTTLTHEQMLWCALLMKPYNLGLLFVTVELILDVTMQSEDVVLPRYHQ